MNEHTEAILSFGLISDLQYAIEPAVGSNFKKTKKRYYRAALDQLETAVSAWSEENPAFILQLGDLIDGRNTRHRGNSQKALDQCLAEFAKLPGVPVHHLIGNHELYNFQRHTLPDYLRNTAVTVLDSVTRQGDGVYYHFSPAVGVRVVILDAFEISCLGYPQDSEQFRYADDWLRSVNKNSDLNDARGLPADQTMMVRYNGAISPAQLQWLDDVLTEAQSDEEMVFVASHTPVHPDSCDRQCVSWNYKEILTVLQKHKSCVLAFFSGHDHNGGYTCDEAGIHHITFQGVIETPPDTECFATVDVYQDRVEVKGAGRIPDYVLKR